MVKRLVSVETETMLPPTSVVDALRNAILPSASGITSTAISDSTPVGRSVLTANTASVARTAIGAGTSNLALGTTASTAKPGNWTPAAADISDSTTLGRTLVQSSSGVVARTAIGAASTGDLATTNATLSDVRLNSVRVVTAGARPSDAAVVYWKTATAPTGALGGDWWYNTGTGVLRYRNGVTGAWV